MIQVLIILALAVLLLKYPCGEVGGKGKDHCYLLSGFQREVRFLCENDTYFMNNNVGVLIQTRTLIIMNVSRQRYMKLLTGS